MRKALNMAAAAALAGCMAACGGGNTSASTENERVAAALDSLFEARYQAPEGKMAPGAAVLIAKGDTIVYERYFGIADIPSGRPVDDSTLFNIASVSKQFTVAALLQQDVDIQRPCSDFFPQYPQEFWHEVTLEHLADHSSGIPDNRDRWDRNACIYADEAQSVQYFPKVEKLKFQPGTAYDYLNPSFLLLANVVEQLSGQDFYEYVQQHIFDTAGMNSTVYFSPDSMPATAAHGYVPAEDGSWKEYDYGEETFFATRPDGGIYSSARDMLQWERALANGKILPAEKLQMAYAPHTNVAESPWCDYQRRPNTWYGLGWFIDQTPGHPVKVYHTGDNGGFQAYVAKYPESETVIIVLENRNDKDRWQMAKAIDQILGL